LFVCFVWCVLLLLFTYSHLYLFHLFCRQKEEEEEEEAEEKEECNNNDEQ